MTGFQPIPGYSGTNPRSEADAMFACTFAEQRKQGEMSLKRIENERADTLKTQEKFEAYKQVQQARMERGL